ncbi:hypothetical protein [Streptomyces sp. NRRL B-1347]|uniref:hypothetical protein n=1 Tax=Streptomyces sp. NRRL B-1347 TaxID=1476877 RepID=UPI0004CAAD7C|nr:hypothetical protein [Streptomyces sp. NRRL B-1347]
MNADQLALAAAVALPAGAAGGALAVHGVRLGHRLTDWADEQAARPAFTAATIPAALVLTFALTALWVVHPVRTRNRLRAARSPQQPHPAPDYDPHRERHRCGAPREGGTPK